MWERQENGYRIFVGEREDKGKRPLGTPRRK
jgi:hypothetical protein